MSLAIEGHQLSRRFNGEHGVHQLDLSVPSGSVYGFLGPNGAGKTTTIRLLLGLLRADSGEMRVLGESVRFGHPDTLKRVGALVESPSLYPHLSGRQNLEVTRCLIGAPKSRIDDVLTLMDLKDAADRPVRGYSLGMRQRLAIALALLGQPGLLILDEPANGLDPAGIIELRDLLKALPRERGITVFVSSHQLGEVEQIASHVGVLHRGRMRFEGSLDQLRQRFQPALIVRCSDPQRASQLLNIQEDTASVGPEGELLLRVDEGGEAEINRRLVGAGIAVSHLARQTTSLEQLFFNVTGDMAEDAA